MEKQAYCPVCKSRQCKNISKTKVKYPEGDLHSHLLDINFVRNRILFDRILMDKEPKEFYFKVCMNCGLIFFSPRPVEKDMAIKYKITDELGDVVEREKARYTTTYDDKRAFEIHKKITKIKDIQNRNVLDIGGSIGFNLKYFLHSNACYVVDYQRRCLIDNVKYLCKTVADIPNSICFTAVLYCHTLEHVVDPVGDILTIKNLLEPNGVLYIEVPFDCYKEYPHVRNFITHINFFSEGSLRYLLDMCGLNIRYLKTRPALGREGYLRTIVAIAENSTPHNRKFNGYNITRKQMKRQNWLWLHTVLLNLGLKKLRFLADISRYIKNARA